MANNPVVGLIETNCNETLDN